jgi:hypothetical protein
VEQITARGVVEISPPLTTERGERLANDDFVSALPQGADPSRRWLPVPGLTSSFATERTPAGNSKQEIQTCIFCQAQLYRRASERSKAGLAGESSRFRGIRPPAMHWPGGD